MRTANQKAPLVIHDNMHISSSFLAARIVQKKWAETSFEKRAKHMKKMQKYIVKNADKLVELLCEDTGKTRIDALADEVLPCAFACKWYAKNAGKILKSKNPGNSIPILAYKRHTLNYIPLGVVGVISPWNYPLSIPFGELVMGLMAGNAIMLKASYEVTPQITKLLSKIVEAGEFPPGLVTFIEAPGPEVSEAFFKNGIDKIFFTGSVRVGKILMKNASETLTPLSLELGGNDAMIVLPDADLERATNGAAWGAYQNAGQTCAGIERAYVHEDVYDEFVEKLAAKTASLSHGSFADFETEVGAITKKEQLGVIQEHVEEALSKGARILAQSQAKNTEGRCYFPASLLVDVDHTMKIMREETFGPILCVMKVRSEEEALRLANDSSYALTSSLWTKDLKRGRSLALQIEAGVTTLNDHCVTHAFSETPWGGWKNSGIGRTHGAEGLKEMSHCKVVHWDLIPTKRNLYWYPFNKATYNGLKAALHCSFPESFLEVLKLSTKLVPFTLAKIFTNWRVKKTQNPKSF